MSWQHAYFWYACCRFLFLAITSDGRLSGGSINVPRRLPIRLSPLCHERGPHHLTWQSSNGRQWRNHLLWLACLILPCQPRTLSRTASSGARRHPKCSWSRSLRKRSHSPCLVVTSPFIATPARWTSHQACSSTKPPDSSGQPWRKSSPANRSHEPPQRHPQSRPGRRSHLRR